MAELQKLVPVVNDQGESLKNMDIEIRTNYERQGIRPPATQPILLPHLDAIELPTRD
jgi:hypothetical protein